MRQVFSALFIALIFSCGAASAHMEQTPVIVDTDVALDDTRALILMLNSAHLDVRAVVTSDGGSSPQAGCKNVQRLVRVLDRDDILIGQGMSLNMPPPPWRGLAESIDWGGGQTAAKPDSTAADEAAAMHADVRKESVKDEENCCADALSIIVKAAAEADQGLSYVCLGPLTNLAEALQSDPSLRDRIKTVFYYGTAPEEAHPDWNTSRDLKAAKAVFASGIPVYAFSLQDEQLVSFDLTLFNDIKQIDSPAAQAIITAHQSGKAGELLAQNHFKAWDETVALYLDNPDLGSFARQERGSSVFRLTQWKGQTARQHYLAMLDRADGLELDVRTPVVLLAYPTHPVEFQPDLRPWVPKIIAMHGLEEWKATVLTNELHRHLGIYSIIGAKMGILAREILNATLDELQVESHAGLKPPLSCMNDGLQVATGASVGRGSITVPVDGPAAPEAVFNKGNKKLRLSLKKNVEARIKSDIRKAIDLHGNLTPEYFKEVRRLSFVYWTEMKRSEIFDRQNEAF